MRAAYLALLLGASALPARGDEVIFKCFFDWSCDINRTCQDAGYDVRYRVDVGAGSVTRLGGDGGDATVERSLLLGDRALTILERPISGGAATTTIMISNGDAVRSENWITGTDLTPMQYLGQCQTM